MTDELELVRKAQSGNRSAAGALYQMHKGFIMQCASKIHRKGYDLNDFVQIASIGFLQAVQSFDCSRGVKLITHAVWSIRKSLQSAIRQDKGPDSLSLDNETESGMSLLDKIPAPEQPQSDDITYKTARMYVQELKSPLLRSYANSMIDVCEEGKPFSLTLVGNSHNVSREYARQLRLKIVKNSQMKELKNILKKN
jgi:RNA polymerase sigma factor (sigma-70 family)